MKTKLSLTDYDHHQQCRCVRFLNKQLPITLTFDETGNRILLESRTGNKPAFVRIHNVLAVVAAQHINLDHNGSFSYMNQEGDLAEAFDLINIPDVDEAHLTETISTIMSEVINLANR